MNLYEEIFKLKNLIRRGWEIRNVKGRLESDAEHTFSMMILGLELMSKNKLDLDELKVLKMIAYHELCEIDAGDITPCDGVSKEEKRDREYCCIQRLAREYKMPEIEEIWLEYQNNTTNEAKFVKSLDKLDAVLQAKIYSEKDDNIELYNEFYANAKEKIKNIEQLKR